MAKTFRLQAAQGDMLLRRVDSVPEGLEVIPAVDGAHILAHSETGHHHSVLERPGVQHFQSAMDTLRSFLVIPEGDNVPVEHHREDHTHETVSLEPGAYEVIRQREFDASAGWRLAAD